MEIRQEVAADGIHYHRVCKLHCHADTGDYIASGISAYDNNGKLVAAIEDVSQDHEWVERLVLRLNHGQADPIHFYDIIFDAVSDAASE